eukprot:1447860-Rhodomonas_salina.2
MFASAATPRLPLGATTTAIAPLQRVAVGSQLRRSNSTFNAFVCDKLQVPDVTFYFPDLLRVHKRFVPGEQALLHPIFVAALSIQPFLSASRACSLFVSLFVSALSASLFISPGRSAPCVSNPPAPDQKPSLARAEEGRSRHCCQGCRWSSSSFPSLLPSLTSLTSLTSLPPSFLRQFPFMWKPCLLAASLASSDVPRSLPPQLTSPTCSSSRHDQPLPPLLLLSLARSLSLALLLSPSHPLSPSLAPLYIAKIDQEITTRFLPVSCYTVILLDDRLASSRGSTSSNRRESFLRGVVTEKYAIRLNSVEFRSSHSGPVPGVLLLTSLKWCQRERILPGYL